MPAILIRPPLATLRWMLYRRPLHPELFDTVALRRVEQDGLALCVRLIPSGHVLQLEGRRLHLVEILATSAMELPLQQRLCDRRFPLGTSGQIRLADGHYHYNLEHEILPPEQFRHLHDELAWDGGRRGLLFHYQPVHRLSLAPLSLVQAQRVRGGISITTFHTFPDEQAVVKTQSLLEWE